jgi:hypothetical protein
MSTKNNLQDALKKAFENHEEPLREAQWERLEGVLASKKPRNKIYMYLVNLLLIAVTAGLTFYFTVKYNEKFVTPIGRNTSTIESKSNTQPLGNESLQATDLTKKSVIAAGTMATVPFVQKFIKPNTSKPTSTEFTPSVNSESKNTEATEITTGSQYSSESNTGNDEKNISEQTVLTQKEDKFEVKDSIQPKANNKLGLNSDTDDKKHKPSKMVLSLAAGYSKLNIKVSALENANTLHKDTKMLYEQSNQNPSSFYMNLGVDFRLAKGFNLGLNSGIQYLHISTPVNLEYKVTQVPFREIDGRIIGYVKDTVNPQTLKVKTTNTTSFIMVPVRFYYTLPINTRNEILISGGANLSAIVSAKGQNLAINENSVQKLSKKNYGTFQAGMLAGLQLSHNLKNNWWLGLDGMWQTNTLKFNTGLGAVKSNLSSYNINLVLRYKL